MPWVRFDDQFPIHRKTAGLTDAAFRLHVAAIFWCARNLTDGFVPKEDLVDVCARVRTPERFATELVIRGAWHLSDEQCESDTCPTPAQGDGWVIHDYLHYQPSAERVRADRADNARRQQEWRDRHASERNAVSNGVSNAPRNSAPSRPVPVPDDSLRSSSISAESGIAKPKAKPKRPTPPDGFAIFWGAYPRKVAKAAAEKAYARAIANGAAPEAILAGVEFYRLERKLQDPKFTKHPATWLNGRCWEDEPDPAYTPPVITGPSVAASAMPPRSDETCRSHHLRLPCRACADDARPLTLPDLGFGAMPE